MSLRCQTTSERMTVSSNSIEGNAEYCVFGIIFVRLVESIWSISIVVGFIFTEIT